MRILDLLPPGPEDGYVGSNAAQLHFFLQELIGSFQAPFEVQDELASLKGRRLAITAVTDATYTIKATDDVVVVNRAGAVTLTLPEPLKIGHRFTVIDGSGSASTNNITIAGPSSGITVNGGTSVILALDYGRFDIQYDGTEYFAQAYGQANGGQLAGLRNHVINGNLDIWQRGTSFTSNGYKADRWRGIKNGGDTITWSQQAFTLGQTDVPHEPKYYMRIDKTVSVGTAQVVQYYIEDVRSLAGKTVTVSFWAKVGAALSGAPAIQMRQYFGTGGSPSGNVDTAGDVPAFTTSWARYTTTVTIPSISGKTLGTDENHALIMLLTMPDETFTLDLAQLQIEEGDVATPFERRPLGLELSICQRYCIALQADGANDQFGVGMASSATAAWVGVPFPVRMRAAPSLTVSAASDFACWDSSTTSRALSSLSANAVTVDGARLACTASGSLTGGDATHLVSENANAKLTFDAELV